MINVTVCVCLWNCSRFRRAGKDIGRAKMLSALNQSIKKPIWSAATGLRPNTFVDGDLYYRVFNNYFHNTFSFIRKQLINKVDMKNKKKVLTIAVLTPSFLFLM